MSIRSIVYYITVRKSASTNGSKRLVLRLKSVMVIAAGKMEVSDLYKTFLDLLL